jgi:hypothetical protein
MEPCGKCCVIVKETIEWNGSVIKVFDLVLAVVLLCSMGSFHTSIHFSSASKTRLMPMYNAFSQLYFTVLVIYLGVLVLPSSDTTAAVSNLVFVVQGFLTHWLWVYMLVRKARPAAAMILPVAIAYAMALGFPGTRNTTGGAPFWICPLVLPSKSTIYLYAGLGVMLAIVLAGFVAKRKDSPVKFYMSFVLVLLVLQAGGAALAVNASLDGGLCIFNFVQIMYAVGFPAVLYVTMQWDSKLESQDQATEALQPFLKQGTADTVERLRKLLKCSETNIILAENLELGVRIGEGGYGEVFKGVYLSTTVAVKRFRVQGEISGDTPKLELPVAIIQELEIATQLRHPFIVQYLGLLLDTVQLDMGLVMEIASGSLFDHLTKETPLPWESTLTVALHSAKALAYLHSRGMIHRDIKPQNILMFGEGSSLVAKVTDFGCSRLKQSSGGRFASSHAKLMYFVLFQGQ